MAKYVRKMDALSAGFYRNLSFFITLLPLLYFAPLEKIVGIQFFWFPILTAGLLGALAQWLANQSLQILPLGIHTAIGTALNIIFSAIIAWFILGQTLSIIQILFMSIIILGGAFFTLHKTHFPHLDPSKWMLGMIYRLLGSLVIALTFVLVAKVSIELNPLVSGYFWEIAIAIFSFGLLLARKMITGQPIAKVSPKMFGMIALVCSPTLIGTGGFVLASKLGPVSIITAIGTLGIVISALLSWALYKEKLSVSSWIAFSVIILGIVGLNIWGGPIA